MKILLFQVDGKFPNLALMKLARYHREKKDEVFLTPFLRDLSLFQPDRVYSSSIFEFSKERRDRLAQYFPDALTGGDGYKPIWNQLQIVGRNLGSNLREVITDIDPEGIVPDYSDYHSFSPSIGYSQRGCRLDCGFCRMKTREGEARKVSGIIGLWRGEPYPKNIVLLDNDFFGQPEWREQLKEARENSFKVCFNQGINIRLVNEEQARELSTVYYCDDQFKKRRLYTAWDNLGDEKVFKAGVQTLKNAGIPPHHLMVYMLVGFRKNETEEEVLYRYNEMAALGCLPYPMVFDRTNKRLLAFQRWVIRRYYKVVSWEDYRTDYRKVEPRNNDEKVFDFQG